MLGGLKSIYVALPSFVTHLIKYFPQPFVFSNAFRKGFNESVKACVHHDVDQAEVQSQRLANTLFQAQLSVPYYRDVKRYDFSEFEIYDAPHKVLSHWERLCPSVLCETPELLISESVPRFKRYFVTTGGSTGEPKSIWLSNTMWAYEWGYVFGLLSTIGVSHRHPRISFRGVRRSSSMSESYSFNPLYNEYRYSPFDLNEKKKDEVETLFYTVGECWVHLYPSSLRFLSQIFGSKLAHIMKNVRGILLVSESVDSEQVKTWQSELSIPILTFYGASERVCFAPLLNLPDGLRYVPSQTYGITEYVDDEIVATGFLNEAMPLIRYRTGDSAVCDVQGRFDKITGFETITGNRDGSFLLGINGERITQTALNTHDPKFQKFGRFQFSQNQLGSAVISIEKVEGMTKDDCDYLLKTFQDKCGPSLTLSACFVDKIPLTQSGKFKYIKND